MCFYLSLFQTVGDMNAGVLQQLEKKKIQGSTGIDSVNQEGDSLNGSIVRHDVFKQQFTPSAIGMHEHESTRCKRFGTKTKS